MENKAEREREGGREREREGGREREREVSHFVHGIKDGLHSLFWCVVLGHHDESAL